MHVLEIDTNADLGAAGAGAIGEAAAGEMLNPFAVKARLVMVLVSLKTSKLSVVWSEICQPLTTKRLNRLLFVVKPGAHLAKRDHGRPDSYR